MKCVTDNISLAVQPYTVGFCPFHHQSDLTSVYIYDSLAKISLTKVHIMLTLLSQYHEK